jgi:phosphate starvation-inducible PhoH-like protein
MKTEPKYKKLILVKSVQTIKGEEIGFLPGTMEEKMAPYMWSFTGNLDKIFEDKATTQQFMQKGTIEIAPIAYIRGVTQDNCIVVIDETQNMTKHMFKTVSTRIGKNCKMIFLGDVEQIDRSNPKESCLYKVFDKFKPVNFVGTVEFNKSECVRNPIIPKILDVLDLVDE